MERSVCVCVYVCVCLCVCACYELCLLSVRYVDCMSEYTEGLAQGVCVNRWLEMKKTPVSYVMT